ncbi:MAG: SPFH domain-containing protein [Candidatus Pacearchaeota archaeon]|jgi:regulator of protease activity HflC (stomatin/prohibitin superfamily)|nr:SPFH domain-containing protein [Clostridia bacterium]
MKKLILILAATCMLFSLQSCYQVKPDPGQESVLVYKPIIFGHGGVDDYAINTGSTWCMFSTDHQEFVITPVMYTEDFTNMIPADNTPVSFSAYITLRIQTGKTPRLYKDFGIAWYLNNVQSTFRTMVRDKSCIYKMFELSSNRMISTQIETKLFDGMVAYVKSINLPVDVVKVSIGAITPPDQVLTETKNTAAQNQSVLTQNARATAELSRKQAEINKAIADKAYMNQMGMTIAEYTHIRQLEITKEQVELLKDHKNVTITFIQGANVPATFPVK